MNFLLKSLLLIIIMTLNANAVPFEPTLLIFEEMPSSIEENQHFDKLEQIFIEQNKYIFEPEDDPTSKYN